MKDRQLKDMCVLLGIQLPAEAYDSREEMLRARDVQPDYEPGIASFVSAAEACARVLEAEEANGTSLDDRFGPLHIAMHTLWSSVELIHDFCYTRDHGYMPSGQEDVQDVKGKDLIPQGGMILGCHSIAPPCHHMASSGGCKGASEVIPYGMDAEGNFLVIRVNAETHNPPTRLEQPSTGSYSIHASDILGDGPRIKPKGPSSPDM